MKIHITATILLIKVSFSAFALDVGPISSFISSNSTLLEKEIKNSSNNGNLVNIKIYRISSPLKEGEIIPMENTGELLLTQDNLVIPANSSRIIYFTYQGEEDDKERYYRIVWHVRELHHKQKSNLPHNTLMKTLAKIGTILIVSPRKVKYDYHYSNGKIINTGNATLRVLAYGPCLKSISKTDCRENYFLIPGREREFSRVDISDKNSHISLWQGVQFVSVK